MGAGVQRWWLDTPDARLHHACMRWRRQQFEIINREIVKARTKQELANVRRIRNVLGEVGREPSEEGQK